jgi:hypothetical protein
MRDIIIMGESAGRCPQYCIQYQALELAFLTIRDGHWEEYWEMSTLLIVSNRYPMVHSTTQEAL